jgi:hypothetical protein
MHYFFNASRVAVVATLALIVIITEAKIDVAAAKKTLADRIQARNIGFVPINKAAEEVHRLGRLFRDLHIYVTFTLYLTADCSDQPYFAAIYGTNMCLPISNATGVTARSTQYTWESANHALNEVYYSDAACTDSVATGAAFEYQFSRGIAGICDDGLMYTMSSTYALPGIGSALQ